MIQNTRIHKEVKKEKMMLTFFSYSLPFVAIGGGMKDGTYLHKV